MQTHSERVSFIWSVADLIRDSFKRGKYQDVILPFTVLRRIDAVLAPTKPQVLEQYNLLKDRLDNLHGRLTYISDFDFYNTSQYDFERLAADHAGLAANLRAYINGFSDNMREVLEKFDFDNTISKLDEADLLYQVVQRFRNVDLHPNRVTNADMGSIFEELIRRFNESLDENPGEHFTPREVVRLMVNLLMSSDESFLENEAIIRNVYDPCCGTGGMLTTAKDRILEINPSATVYVHGQEVNPETFAVCKSDMFIKSPKSGDADRIAFGSTLSNDGHAGRAFDYILANPPYGKDWKRDEAAVKAEAERGHNGRFGAGTPRISDGQLLFLQHMLSKMNPLEQGGGRVAIIMNGSPLFTGDAGSGESEIRRWILENDWLDAIVALPEQLFYNTGIATYVWILTNRKEERRRGKVQLIDATAMWQPMRRSLGDKRRQISDGQIDEITEIYRTFEEDDTSKIFPTTAFGYRKITVEQPLRLNFQASPERIERLPDERAFQNLATSDKRDRAERAADEEAGRGQQSAILAMLRALPGDLYTNRAAFDKLLTEHAMAAGAALGAPLRKAILSALSERDETAGICRTEHGTPEPDPRLRHIERVPINEPIEAYVRDRGFPIPEEGWISRPGDTGEVLGYEIRFHDSFLSDRLWAALGSRAESYIPLIRIARRVRKVRSQDILESASNRNSVVIPRLVRPHHAITNDTIRSIDGWQVELDPEVALAQYYSGFLSGDSGHQILSLVSLSLSSGSYIDEHAVKRVLVPKVTLVDQQSTIAASEFIRTLQAQLSSVEHDLWASTSAIATIQRQLSELLHPRDFESWLNTLPFPLASILRLYRSDTRVDYQVEHLLHFFEALAQYVFCLLLSGFWKQRDEFAKNRDRWFDRGTPEETLRRASFGTWVVIGGRMAKRVRQLIADRESQDIVTASFGIRHPQRVESLFSSELYRVLQTTSDYRNNWKGHGGVRSENVNRSRLSLLEEELAQIHRLTQLVFDEWRLVRPIPYRSMYRRGIHETTCEQLSGSDPIFLQIQVGTHTPLDVEALYVADTEASDPLQLLPLFSMMSSPGERADACYFYSRLDPNGARFVSYHYEGQPEVTVENSQLFGVLDAMGRVAIDPDTGFAT